MPPQARREPPGNPQLPGGAARTGQRGHAPSQQPTDVGQPHPRKGAHALHEMPFAHREDILPPSAQGQRQGYDPAHVVPLHYESDEGHCRRAMLPRPGPARLPPGFDPAREVAHWRPAEFPRPESDLPSQYQAKPAALEWRIRQSGHLLGKGSFGCVYGVDNPVTAIKVQTAKNKHGKPDPWLGSNIKHELRILGKLTDAQHRPGVRSQHICQVLEFAVDTQQKLWFIEMPKATCVSSSSIQPSDSSVEHASQSWQNLLDHWHDRKDAMQPAQVLECIRSSGRYSMQMLSALIFIHNQGIVHCDVKPGNCLIQSIHDRQTGGWYNCLVMTDFGLSAYNNSEAKKQGTEIYMAPELKNLHLYKNLRFSPAQDDWSAGITIKEVEQSLAQLENAVLRRGYPQVPQLLREAFTSYHSFAEAVGQAMIVKDPEARLKSASEFLSGEEKIAEHRGRMFG